MCVVRDMTEHRWRTPWICYTHFSHKLNAFVIRGDNDKFPFVGTKMRPIYRQRRNVNECDHECVGDDYDEVYTTIFSFFSAENVMIISREAAAGIFRQYT